jgi:hypothetical protein
MAIDIKVMTATEPAWVNKASLDELIPVLKHLPRDKSH